MGFNHDFEAPKIRLSFRFFFFFFFLVFGTLWGGYGVTAVVCSIAVFALSFFNILGFCILSPTLAFKTFSSFAGPESLGLLVSMWVICLGLLGLMAVSVVIENSRHAILHHLKAGSLPALILSEISLAYMAIGVLANIPNIIFGGIGGLALSVALSILGVAGLLYLEIDRRIPVREDDCPIWTERRFVLLNDRLVSPTHPDGYNRAKAALILALFGVLSIGDAVRCAAFGARLDGANAGHSGGGSSSAD